MSGSNPPAQVAQPGPRGVTSESLARPCWAPGSSALALCRSVGPRDHSVGPRDHRGRYARGPVHRGLLRRAWPRPAQHWQAALTAVWRVAARSEQASGRISSQPEAVRCLMATRAARWLAEQAASGPREALPAAAQVWLAARLEALRAAEASLASAVPPLAGRHAEAVAEQGEQQRVAAAPSFAVLYEAVQRVAPERRKGLDELARRSGADVSAVPRLRSVRRAPKPARVGPARIARVTAAASTTRQ